MLVGELGEASHSRVATSRKVGIACFGLLSHPFRSGQSKAPQAPFRTCSKKTEMHYFGTIRRSLQRIFSGSLYSRAGGSNIKSRLLLTPLGAIKPRE